MKHPSIILLAVLALLCLTGCSLSDSSPEVQAQAMSYGGNVPVLNAKGAVVGAEHIGESHRVTMLHQ